MFETYDKVVKSDTLLYNLNFDIKILKKKETFEIFYIRFSAVITPLNLFDIYKIFNLKRTIFTRLRYRISGENYSFFRDLIARLRYIVANLKTIDKIASLKKKSRSENKSGNSLEEVAAFLSNRNIPTFESNTNSFDLFRPRRYKYLKLLIDRIAKEDRCFKCLKTDYRL